VSGRLFSPQGKTGMPWCARLSASVHAAVETLELQTTCMRNSKIGGAAVVFFLGVWRRGRRVWYENPSGAVATTAGPFRKPSEWEPAGLSLFWIALLAEIR